jgi:hypothetical protein
VRFALSKSRLTAKVHRFRLKVIVPPIFLPGFGDYRQNTLDKPVAFGFAGTRKRPMRMPAEKSWK